MWRIEIGPGGKTLAVAEKSNIIRKVQERFYGLEGGGGGGIEEASHVTAFAFLIRSRSCRRVSSKR